MDTKDSIKHYQKEAIIEDLLQKYETAVTRYIEAEQFIVKLNQLTLFERMFFMTSKISIFVQLIANKYNDRTSY